MMRKQINSFEEAEKYLNDTPKFTTKHSIKETRLFLEKMGSPDKNMKIIHVAGTNGKGSTCAYLSSVLQEANIKTALFISPHLVDICERFSINGEMMSHAEFLESFLNIYNMLEFDDEKESDQNDINKCYHPSYFEFLFFMAMDYFSRKKVEWCILETGLGGMLDATNSVHRKEATVITRIGLDHMEYLGDTIEKIAAQKKGIVRENTPVIYNDFVSEASKVIAEGIDSKLLYPIGKKSLYKYEKSIETLAFSMADGYYRNVWFSLDTVALYQIENAMLAIRTIEALGLCDIITNRILESGLSKCHWAGRMEELIPDLYIDGAHNPDGIRAFLETISQDGLEKSGRSLLFGVVADKNFYDMLEEIVVSDLFNEIWITPLHSSRSADIVDLKKALESYSDIKYHIATEPISGLEQMLEKGLLSDKKRIYIAGSLYLVGEIKKAFMDDSTAF